MNRFNLLNENDDIGITAVENMFINHFLPNARGDYVKVYLYALKCAQSNTDTMPDDEEIAKTLKIKEEDVAKAFEYWQKEQVLTISEDGLGKIISFRNIQTLLLVPTSSAKSEKGQQENPNQKILQMNKNIEDILGRNLTHDEIMMFLNWIEEYKFTPQMVEIVVRHCVINLEKKQKRYWDAVALGLYDDEINTYDKVIEHFNAREKRNKEQYEIFKYLGLNSRGSGMTGAEKKLCNKWFDEYKLSLEDIKKACDETTASNKPSFKYLDSIIYSMYIDDKPKRKKKSKGKSTKVVIENDLNYQNYSEEEISKIMDGLYDE